MIPRYPIDYTFNDVISIAKFAYLSKQKKNNSIHTSMDRIIINTGSGSSALRLDITEFTA